MFDFVLITALIISFGYFIVGVFYLIQFFIFRGFAPFLPSRPMVIEKNIG